MIPGQRPTAQAKTGRGVCPVCRSLQRLLIESGKVAKHGRTAAAPRGCAGSYQRPMRVDSAGKPVEGGTVVGWKNTDGDAGPTAQGSPEVQP